MDAAESHHDFESAGRLVLTALRRRFGLDAWSIARVNGDQMVLLQAEGQLGAIAEGQVLPWADSICCRMVHGPGSLRWAADLQAVPALRDAPLAAQVGAYVGWPLRREDGSLFGVLAGHGLAPRAPFSADDQGLMQLLAELLTTALQLELRCAEASRLNEHRSLEALADGLTSLHGPAAWETLLDAEDRRCHRFGHPAAVLMLALEGDAEASDERLLQAVDCLREAVRDQDAVARLGPARLAVLAVECDADGTASQLRRVQAGLQAAGLRARCVSCQRDPRGSLQQAAREAEAALAAQ